ncbi:hypothetical protein hairong_147 [Pseudomonas phage hairong]|nr:hypothetical protein hairong_147 [Pseudomonas phage hairong]
MKKALANVQARVILITQTKEIHMNTFLIVASIYAIFALFQICFPTKTVERD